MKKRVKEELFTIRIIPKFILSSRCILYRSLNADATHSFTNFNHKDRIDRIPEGNSLDTIQEYVGSPPDGGLASGL